MFFLKTNSLLDHKIPPTKNTLNLHQEENSQQILYVESSILPPMEININKINGLRPWQIPCLCPACHYCPLSLSVKCKNTSGWYCQCHVCLQWSGGYKPTDCLRKEKRYKYFETQHNLNSPYEANQAFFLSLANPIIQSSTFTLTSFYTVDSENTNFPGTTSEGCYRLFSMLIVFE